VKTTYSTIRFFKLINTFSSKLLSNQSLRLILIEKILSFFNALFVSAWVISYLGPEKYIDYIFVLSLYSFSLIFIKLGLDNYFIAVIGKKVGFKQGIFGLVILRFLFLFIFLLFIWIYYKLNIINFIYLSIYGLIATLDVSLIVYSVSFRSIKNVTLSIIGLFFFSSITICLLVFEADPIYFLLPTLMGSLAQFIFGNLSFYRSGIKLFFKNKLAMSVLNFDSGDYRDMLRIAFSSLVSIVFFRFEALFMTGRIETIILASFFVSKSFVDSVLSVISSTYVLSYPLLRERNSRDFSAHLLVFYNILSIIFIFLGYLLYVGYFKESWGEDYMKVEIFLFWLLITSPILVSGSIIDFVLMINARFDLILWKSCLSLVLKFIFYVLMSSHSSLISLILANSAAPVLATLIIGLVNLPFLKSVFNLKFNLSSLRSSFLTLLHAQ
jgi:hypothetical protein